MHMQRLVHTLAFAMIAWIGIAGTVLAAKDTKDDKGPTAPKNEEHTGTFVAFTNSNSKIKILENGKEVEFELKGDAKATFEGIETSFDALPTDHPVTLFVTVNYENVFSTDVPRPVVTKIDFPAPWHRTGLGVFGILAGIIAISFGVGRSMASSLRMPDHDWKIGLMVFCTLIGAAITWMGWPPSLGVDLRGGVKLVYEIDPNRNLGGTAAADDPKKSDAKKDDTRPENKPGKVDMGKLIDAINKRINPGGQKEVIVRVYGENKVEVIVPKADRVEIDRVRRLISTSGLLQFRIVATEERTDRGILAIAKALPKQKSEILVGDMVKARWVKLNRQKFPPGSRGRMVIRSNGGEDEALVEQDAPQIQVNGDQLAYSRRGRDNNGRNSVDFGFKDLGALNFSKLTGTHLPDGSGSSVFHFQLAIVLDNELLSAPSLNTQISANGQITGDFTDDEVKSLVDILNAGSLPAALTQEPVSQQTIDPLLGADTIRTATFAMWLSCIAVPIFMIFYYRFSGIVATLTTALHMLLIVAVMIMIHAAFTLTGLAGLALTVGMAVDANVLIYERMREELARGASLKMAIRNGFDRALATIIDTNVTTLIAATVLYVIGTDQVRGFAVTLWLGVILNVFTATFGTRVLFNVAEKLHWIRELKMMQFIGVPKVDFMAKRHFWLTFSAITSIIGLAAFFSLGRQVWDIDFTGGSSVDIVFAKDHKQTDGQHVKELLEKSISDAKATPLEDLDVYGISIQGQEPNTMFRVVTSDQDVPKVKADIVRAFAGQLRVLDVKVGAVTLATATAPSSDKPNSDITFPPRDLPESGPKLEEPKLEEKKPEEKKPEEKTPDKVEEKKDTPSTEKEPASKESATDEKKQSSTIRFRPDVALAALGNEAIMLAQADDKKADEKTSDDKRADDPKPDAFPPIGPPPIVAPFSPIAPASTVEGASGSSFVGGSRFTINLSDDATYGLVNLLLGETEKNLEQEFPGAHHDLTFAKFGGKSSEMSKTFDVQISLPPEKAQPFINEFTKLAGAPDFSNADFFGPQVADKTKEQTIYALVASWALIILYVWIRFQRVAYGLAAVIALIHDVIIAIGCLALAHYVSTYMPGLASALLLAPFKVNLTIIAAILTIIGYSVNDTIVVFDRIREVKGKAPDVTGQIVNDSVNQTLSRTLLTSFTVFLVVLILYIFGGVGVRAFSFAMMVGVATGTYSSIYIASPILVWLENLTKSNRERDRLTSSSTGR